MSISELLATTSETPLEDSFSAQVQKCTEKKTKGGKPYLEWDLADATGVITLKTVSYTHLTLPTIYSV